MSTQTSSQCLSVRYVCSSGDTEEDRVSYRGHGAPALVIGLQASGVSGTKARLRGEGGTRVACQPAFRGPEWVGREGEAKRT